MRWFGHVNKKRGAYARPHHRVVARAVARASHDRDRGYRGVRDRVDQLRAVLDDAFLLDLLADHEAGDVLQEQAAARPPGCTAR